jgi:hypothetical protein
MFKRIIVLILCLIMIIPCLAHAEEGEHPARLEKPASLSVRANDSGDLLLRLTQPDSIMNQIGDGEYWIEYWIYYELDWKINDGPWKFNSNWDNPTSEGLMEYYERIYDKYDVCGYLNNIGHDDRNSFDKPVFPSSLNVEAFDLGNNTYSFRYRYVYEYDYMDPVTEECGYKRIVSPYSDVASIGKGVGGQIPNSLEAPQNLVGELKRYENGQPYFHFTCKIPKSVEEVNKLTEVQNYIDWKIGNGRWATESGELPFEKGDNMLADFIDADPVDRGGWGEVNIEKNTYYFRMYFQFQKPDGSFVKSPPSNVVVIGTPAFYEGASNWAKPELNKAAEYGLIPDILKGVDMTKPITREEFAELAVLLYEKTTKKAASAASPNPFTDTTNKQILKAYDLGITKGTSATTFSPKVLINREECATMLYRAIRAIAPGGNYSIAGVKDFPDQKYISSWAVEGTKYMAKLGIIKGDSKGNFMPKATTSAQEATGYGMATREAAVLMTVRTYDTMDDVSSKGQVSDTKGNDSTALPEGYPSGLIPLYENGKIASVKRKTFATGNEGYEITIDYKGEKFSEVNGHYCGLMLDAENYDGVVGIESYHYGNKGGYRIEIDVVQHFPDQYSCTVTIAYYKTN